METCGYICVTSQYEQFLMRCAYCETDVDIERWPDFVHHFRNIHKSTEDNIWDQSKVNYTSIQRDDGKSIKLDVVNQNSVKEEAFVAYELYQQDEAAYVNITSEMDTEDLLSSSNISEVSIHYETELENEFETVEEEKNNIALAVTPTYNFNPSFFRRNPLTLKFITAYKNYPCLWNPKHAKYKEEVACNLAYQQFINELDTKIGIVLNKQSLKAAIKKLHRQYNTILNRVENGSQKTNSIAFHHFTRCNFLKVCNDQIETSTNDKIQLDFTKKNRITTDLISKYANFPMLYDSNHQEFSNMHSRKQAYETLAAELSVPYSNLNSDDIFRAIQSLRQWYYKSTKNTATASESEMFYLKMCDFLPPKMFKQKLICEICNKITYSDHVLQSHMSKDHNIGELPFKCTLCERSFDGRADLATHTQRVHIGKTHKCNYCDRTFAVTSDLHLHIRTHTGNKPFICELCGKAFRLRSQLKLHATAIHTKIRAFKCDMCPKDFLKKSHLSDHIKSHLNIRDKICTVCGKGFTSCHSLIRHRQIHSEVKKFACQLCDARFSQFVGLNAHMKRTHNIIRNALQKGTSETKKHDIN